MIKWFCSVLNVKVINGCNLRCEGCSHHSHIASLKSKVNIDKLIDSFKKLEKRIWITDHISLLGGETFLEPRWSEVLTEIEKVFPYCRLRFYTNGVYLLKNYDSILKHMSRGTELHISIHEKNNTTLGASIKKTITEFYKKLIQDKFTDFERIYYKNQYLTVWNKSFIEKKKKIYPHNSKDIFKSYAGCVCPNIQFYKNKLWKCATIAYLKDTLGTYKQLNDPEWQPYLKYKGLSLDASNDEYKEFFTKQYTPESICSICPSKHYNLPHKQDTSIQKVDIKQL
jgi:organic radical activating enzyme